MTKYCKHLSTYSSENVEWHSEPVPIRVQPFSQPSGPQVSIPTVVKDVFFLFFTSSILEHVVKESNVYAAEMMGESFARWQLYTVEELCAYMGFMILMGIVKLPKLTDYWNKDAVYYYSPVASKITRDRFLELNRYLHFADNLTLRPPQSPGYDKLGKVRPIINMIGDRFAAVCTPGLEISIDEAMMPFKGRSSLKQFIPNKPVKRGIKSWMRADAATGYVSAFEVYTGKKGDKAEKGLSAKVVKSLCEPLYNTNRHVYFDNFFSSVNLSLDLLRKGLYSCGTLRSNRKGFPATLKRFLKTGLEKRGDNKTVQAVQEGNLTISLWQDSKPVVVIATNSDPTTTTTVNRRKRDGTSSVYSCPHSVSYYNKFMGGVDRNDQLRGYYRVRSKCRKHYKYVFWFIFDLAITNAYILYKSHPDHRRTKMLDFRVTLAKELIGGYCNRKRTGRPSISGPLPIRFRTDHFPSKATRHRCHYCCNRKHKRRTTTWYCRACRLYLCHTGEEESDCFWKQHN